VLYSIPDNIIFYFINKIFWLFAKFSVSVLTKYTPLANERLSTLAEKTGLVNRNETNILEMQNKLFDKEQ
jgi:hypothetical protein